MQLYFPVPRFSPSSANNSLSWLKNWKDLSRLWLLSLNYILMLLKIPMSLPILTSTKANFHVSAIARRQTPKPTETSSTFLHHNSTQFRSVLYSAIGTVLWYSCKCNNRMNERFNRASVVLTSANAPTPYTETTRSYVFALRVSWACVGPVVVVLFLFSFFRDFACEWTRLRFGASFRFWPCIPGLFLYSFITSDSRLWKGLGIFVFCWFISQGNELNGRVNVYR